MRRQLLERIRHIPHVLADPAPTVDILAFNPLGTVLAVRSSCHNDHYSNVYFDTTSVIADIMSAYPVPETTHLVRGIPAGSASGAVGV